MITTPEAYFRTGVGAVLYARSGQLLTFQRADNPSIWQFPQGDIDLPELPEAALWRELYEETTITKDQVTKVDPYPDWLLYEYPTALRQEQYQGRCWGQAQRWFYLEIPETLSPTLSDAPDQEFSAYRWSAWAELIEIADYKRANYQRLAEYHATLLA